MWGYIFVFYLRAHVKMSALCMGETCCSRPYVHNYMCMCVCVYVCECVRIMNVWVSVCVTKCVWVFRCESVCTVRACFYFCMLMLTYLCRCVLVVCACVYVCVLVRVCDVWFLQVYRAYNLIPCYNKLMPLVIINLSWTKYYIVQTYTVFIYHSSYR